MFIHSIRFLALACYILLFSSCQEKPKKQILADDTSQFLEDIRNYYFLTLDSTIHYLRQMDTTVSPVQNKKLFTQVRYWYKMNEPMMMAYDYQNYLTINGPNLLKVEIDDYTDIKRIKPTSLQVLEETLFSEKIDNSALHRTLRFLQARFPFIRKNHIIYRQRDKHSLKMIRDAIVNVAAKGITGFDSPILANSMAEAVITYQSLANILEIYQEGFKDPSLYELWQQEIKGAIVFLQSDEFDSFDRYTFIKNYTNAQLVLVNSTQKDWNIAMSRSRELDPSATNLFSKEFFNLSMFSVRGAPAATPERAALGKALFNDTNLSSSKQMSCGSCHKAELAFTDGLPKAKGTNSKELIRNTPALPYTVYQKKFFYDGRASGLESQILSVANNVDEFHIEMAEMEQRVLASAQYEAQFEQLYAGETSNENIRNAITAYIRNLTPFDSKFDLNMQGKENSLTKNEIRGFNLFMGKAGCGTCHFAPTFFGTVPPKYDETEFENLGVPANASFENPVLDDDPGMFYPYSVEEKRHFFKTSTVRNIALTAPYMHNGVYNTLEEVMNFYNVGGGQGMGLDVPYQTLPPDSLHLNANEIDDIIAFMRTLTDSEYTVEQPKLLSAALQP